MIDLNPTHLKTVQRILKEYVPDCEVRAFGSRVTWTAKDYSDLDLAIVGPEAMDTDVLWRLKEAFEESDLPIRVDVIDWHAISESFRKVVAKKYEVIQQGGKKRKQKAGNGWTEIALSDVVDIIGGGTPKRNTPEYWGGSIPWLSVKDFNDDYRHVDSAEESITEIGLANSNTKVLPAGYLIMSARGTIGPIAQLSRPMAFNQSCYGVNAKTKYTRNDFLYYLLKHSIDRIKQITHGAVFDTITRETFAHIVVHLPPLPEQRAIAHTLGTLDDKIELNRRMNETLETMARAIFKDWFVDFGPTRAKMQGHQPYLPPEIWNLFPDKLDPDGIPEGWEVSEIGQEVDAVGGATPSTKETSYWEKGVYNWATPKDLSRLTSPILLDTNRKITDAGVKKISSGLLPVGTVLLSSRAPVGYLAVAGVPTAVNQGFIAMVCEKRLPNVFVLFWCNENLPHIQSIAGGSTFAEISKKVFRPIPVIIPSEPVLTAYESIVRPLFDCITANVKECVSLAQTRNLLLPKLMSGEVRLTETTNALDASVCP